MVNGDPVFGFYPKPAEKTKSFLFKFVSSTPAQCREPLSKVPYPEFDRAITLGDIENLKKATASQEFFASSPRLSVAVMTSTKAFADVTKQEFAKAYIEAIQQPQCAGLYAIVAMGRKVMDVKDSLGIGYLDLERTEYPDLSRQIEALSSAAYGLKNDYTSDFLASGQYFRAGAWESAPP